VFGRQHGIFVSVKNAVARFLRTIFAADKLRVLLPEQLEFFAKGGFVHVGPEIN
jgi:hypothetical protein